MFDVTPDPIALTIGPLAIGWYGLGYALGLAAAYLLLTWLAKRAGEDPELVGNGIIIVAIAALIGGRLYHVIDQWALYADNPISIILPPYSGLGAYGGLATGIIAVVIFTRWKRVSFWRWADIIAPSVFVMQAIARWGNYFNQELYGPPTTLPWGIPIDCEYRISAYLCDAFPFATTRFHPLFLYESISGAIGAAVLIWLGFRLRTRLRPGDLFMVFIIWYSAVRFALETLRSDNWTFFDIPVAQLVSLGFIVGAVIVLIIRHRPGAAADDPPPSVPGVATWGAIGPNDWKYKPIDEPWANVGDPFDDDDDPFDDDPDAIDAGDAAAEPAAAEPAAAEPAAAEPAAAEPAAAEPAAAEPEPVPATDEGPAQDDPFDDDPFDDIAPDGGPARPAS
jgi:phosphatidylglycerol:prolipoprotein diacylglycerol transferase